MRRRAGQVANGYELSSFQGKQIVIIVGARSMAVMTGWIERPAMEAPLPDYLFDDLSDTQQVLDAITLPVGEDSRNSE